MLVERNPLLPILLSCATLLDRQAGEPRGGEVLDSPDHTVRTPGFCVELCHLPAGHFSLGLSFLIY